LWAIQATSIVLEELKMLTGLWGLFCIGGEEIDDVWDDAAERMAASGENIAVSRRADGRLLKVRKAPFLCQDFNNLGFVDGAHNMQHIILTGFRQTCAGY
jgi:hypothetical protein